MGLPTSFPGAIDLTAPCFLPACLARKLVTRGIDRCAARGSEAVGLHNV